jgi:energy-coupling factor transporter ATP-binding protein EcfA2
MNISSISFENFRVFLDRSEFDLAPITILTGANSSGKSTIIKGLKLFQLFWKQGGFGDFLRFENGNHPLCNFEMTLSKHSEKQELIARYSINHVLFDSLHVELIFEQVKGDPLKNGILKESRVISKDGLVIFTVRLRDTKDKKDRELLSGYNEQYIIEVLIPKLRKLYTEYSDYEEKIENTGDVTEQIKCQKHGIDYDRYSQLQDLFVWYNNRENTGDSFEPDKDRKSYEFTRKFCDFLNSYNESVFACAVGILKLFSQISHLQDTLFAKELYRLLCEKYPETAERFNYISFKEFMDAKDIASWTNKFLLDGKQSFESTMKELDKFPVSCGEAHEFDSDVKSQFYNPCCPRKVSYPEEKIWWNDIFRDAVTIAQEIRNDKFISTPFGNAKELLSSLHVLLRNITYLSIKEDFASMYFINSIRANSQRFYSLDFRESDFNLFIVEFLKLSHSEQYKAFLKKWLQEFEIADDYSIELIDGSGSQVFLIRDEEKINLVDLGYGVTQFLPVLLKIVYCDNMGKRTIVIEEPETNLHPKFQSMLADLFVDAQKTFGISFIIETHSEYLIRKLQYLTARKELAPQTGVVIHYIDNADRNKRAMPTDPQVRKITIEANGRLSSPFGSGFYDEADNLALALLEYSLN